MKKYRVVRSARTDMQEIWNYIADDNASAATRLIAEFRSAFELLGKHPEIGHIRRELTRKDVRFWPVGEYLIVYRRNEVMEVLAVYHGARDLNRLLRRRLAP